MTLFLDGAWRPHVSPPHHQRWILPSIPPFSSSTPLPSQFTVLMKPVQIKVVNEEVASPLAKQAIRRVPSTSGLSLSDVRHPKERRRVAANHQPEVVKQDFSQCSPLPDGYCPGCGGPSSPWRLGSFDQSEGCVLPHPRQPTLWLKRPSLRVPGPPVRLKLLAQVGFIVNDKVWPSSVRLGHNFRRDVNILTRASKMALNASP